MNKLIVSGLAFAAMATAALAQQPPPPPEQMVPPAPQDHGLPPSGGPDVIAHPDDMLARDHVGLAKDGSRQETNLYHHHRPMPPPPSKAAHFRVENGGTKIDIKCADDEPTKVCADVLIQLIDKLATPSDAADSEQD